HFGPLGTFTGFQIGRNDASPIDHIFVGDDVIAGGGTKIFTNAPKGRVLLGYPAVKMETHLEMQKALRRLPRIAAEMRSRKTGTELSHDGDKD
ncbi:MAG: hypothetical protein ACK4GW_14175, partial [Pseudorhodobacter sp.]